MRKNPKRIPKTKADVDKAWEHGALYGIEFCTNVFLFTLKDKLGFSDEDVLKLRDAFLGQIDGINKGYCTYADVKRALGGDYNLFVNMEDLR